MRTTTIYWVAIVLLALAALGFGVALFLPSHKPAPLPAGATPAVCVEALDYAHEGFVNNADAMDAARRAVAAASRGDREGVADATADLDDANQRMDAIVDDAARTARACREGAR